MQELLIDLKNYAINCQLVPLFVAVQLRVREHVNRLTHTRESGRAQECALSLATFVDRGWWNVVAVVERVDKQPRLKA